MPPHGRFNACAAPTLIGITVRVSVISRETKADRCERQGSMNTSRITANLQVSSKRIARPSQGLATMRLTAVMIREMASILDPTMAVLGHTKSDWEYSCKAELECRRGTSQAKAKVRR